MQPQYAITQDDLIKTSEEDDLIQAERSNDQDVFNCWPVTYTDMRNSDTYPNLGSQASYSTLTIEVIETVGASNFGATKRAPETDGRLFDTPAAARALSKLLAQRSVWRERDKGYSYGHMRAWLRRRKVEPVIPQRSDQIGGKGWLPARDEKLDLNYLTMVKLAMIERCFRVLFRRSLAERGRRTTTGW